MLRAKSAGYAESVLPRQCQRYIPLPGKVRRNSWRISNMARCNMRRIDIAQHRVSNVDDYYFFANFVRLEEDTANNDKSIFQGNAALSFSHFIRLGRTIPFETKYRCGFRHIKVFGRPELADNSASPCHRLEIFMCLTAYREKCD